MKLTDGGVFLKSDMVKPGDIIKILNAGEWVESVKFTYEDGKPKKDFIIKVLYNNKEYSMRINATNRKALIAAYGAETDAWVGSGAKIDVANVMVSGVMKKTILLIPDAEIMWK